MPSIQKQNYRNYLEMIRQILQAVNNEGPVGTTRLMCLSNMSTYTYYSKIKSMIEANLINLIIENRKIGFKKMEAKRTFVITEKGKTLLDRINRLEQICDLSRLDRLNGYY